MNLNLKILYVEDEDGVRDSLSKFLARFASKLYVASNGREGLELYKNNEVDIVISDIKMPQVDGIEMVSYIKKINPKQCVIFTTAHSESSFFINAIDMQVDGYVLKPVDLKKLQTKMQNVKEQISIEKELLFQKMIRDEILQLQDNILFILDKAKNIIFVNQNFYSFFDISTLEEFNTKVDSIADLFINSENFFYPKEKSDWFESISDTANRVIALKDKDNKTRSFVVSLKNIQESAHNIVVLTEITSITAEKKFFEDKAYTDELTQISNRSSFEKEYEKEVKRFDRGQTPLSFIILDIDDFKNINDTYGHIEGDVVLKALANLVKKNLRETDIFARWGGEEFVIILPSTSLTNSVDVADTLRGRIENHIFNNGVSVTCSFGVSEFKNDDTKDSIMKKIDTALYKAKTSGKNRVEISV